MDTDMGTNVIHERGQAFSGNAPRSGFLQGLIIAGLVSGVLLMAPAYGASWDFTPRVTVSETYSDNVDLVSSGEEDDLITEISPGFSLSRNSGRLDLSVNYSLQTLYYADREDEDEVNQRLAGNAKAELARELLFLDANTSISQSIVDARSARPVDTITGSDNVTDVRSHSVSPYLTPRFGNFASGLFRYRFNTVDAGDTVSDTESHVVSANLRSGRAFSALAWSVDYQQSKEDRDGGNDVDQERANADASFRLNSQLSLIAEAGKYDNDFDSVETVQNGSYWGAGFNWIPSRYWSISAMSGNNFETGTLRVNPTNRTNFTTTYRSRDVGLNPGITWTGAFSHRTRRSTWELGYLEDTQTVQQLFAELVRVGVFQQFNEEGELVNQFLVPEFRLSLTDEVIERKRANAGITFRTGKSNLGLQLFNERRNSLGTIGDEEESSRGLIASWRWRYTGRTTTNLRGSWQRTEFSSDGREDDLWYLDANVQHQLGRSLNASLAYRFTENESTDAASEYDENRVIARMSMSF